MDMLITLSDIKQYCKDVASNIDDNAIRPYIIEAQVVELRALMGRFFNVFLKDIESQRMIDLLNGRPYTVDDVEIEFAGVKPVIAYHAYSRLVQKHGMQVTRFGLVKKETEFSSNVDDKTIATHALDAKTIARVYEEDFRAFMEANGDTYPEWGKLCGTGGGKPNISIKISAIG